MLDPSKLIIKRSLSHSESLMLRKQQEDLIEELGHPDSWPNNPVAVRRAPGMISTSSYDEISKTGFSDLIKPVSIHAPEPLRNSLIPIESDYFSGHILVLIAHLPDSPTELMRGKRRQFQYVLQGRFKKDLPFSQLYTGQAFDSPLLTLPSKWILNIALALLSTLQPAMQVSLTGDRPYILSPLMSTCQHIVVSRSGEEPPISGIQVKEDLSLIDPAVFTNMSNSRRQSFFSKRVNLEKYRVDPELIYTFDFYQHLLNFGTFQFDLGFLNYDLFNILGVRPIQIMTVAWDPLASEPKNEEIKEENKEMEIKTNHTPPNPWPFVYNLEIWHRRCFTMDLYASDSESNGRDSEVQDERTKSLESEKNVEKVWNSWFH